MNYQIDNKVTDFDNQVTENEQQKPAESEQQKLIENEQRLAESEQRFTKDERETILVYNEADGFWTIYSAVQSHIRKFDKLGYEVTDVDSYQDGNVAAKYYKVPKRAISFRSPIKVAKVMTEEQKREFAERMKKGKS